MALENRVLQYSENEGEKEICAVANTDILVGFEFDVIISLVKDTEGNCAHIMCKFKHD